MGSHKAQLDWPDLTESVPHSPVENRFIYFSFPGENAGVITAAHVPSDRAVMLFHVHIPFTPELFLRSKCLIPGLLCRGLTIRSAGNMAESNPFQISPVWIKTASKARYQRYTARLCLK